MSTETTRQPFLGLTTGLWSCDGPTHFEWTFGVDETVHIVEGLVHIEYLGNKMTLVAGDTAFFRAKTKAIWHVPQRVLKTYVLYEPGRLSRWYRKLSE